MTTIRVAAVQFATTCDVEENLATALRMIDTAATEAPLVMVLPEFANHLSIYDDGGHCWSVAVELDGPWVTAIAAKAAEHGCWIQVNVTMRRDGPSTSRQPAPGRITNTNLLFDPTGWLAADNDKTVLMGAEGDYLSAAEAPAELVDAGFALIGTYACMDGVIPEVPRGLAVRGATLMLNSLNSFALDEASLHIPVRAAENKVWVVACCKVGPLLPPEKIELFSAAMGIPGSALCGAGESQVVAPDGTVVAMGPRHGEAVVVADIDLDVALDKLRPDGTDIMSARRPTAYVALAHPTPGVDDHPRAEELTVAVVGAHADPVAAVTEAVEAGARLVVLGELVGDGQVQDLMAVAGEAVIVTTVREGDAHVGLVLDNSGIVGRQLQLHRIEAHEWQRTLGDSLVPVDLPWGRLGVLVGDDAVFPEVGRLAALAGCDVVAVPFTRREEWETTTGLIERAAENRVCLVAADASGGPGLIVDLPPDFTLWAPSRERVFDGTINRPDVTRSDPAARVTMGSIHPARSVNRQISKGTNLVDDRPWRLMGALVSFA